MAGVLPAEWWTRVFRPAQIAILLSLLYVYYTAKIPICQGHIKANFGIVIFYIRGAANPLATPQLKRTSLLYAGYFTLSSFRGGF